MIRDDLDDMVQELEERIRKEEMKRYSTRVLNEAKDPGNFGRIKEPDCWASITGPCGDTMEFSLRVDHGLIKDIRFVTDGCGSSIACGSITTKMVMKRTLKEALAITEGDILEELGGLPEENRHCARLAADTLHEAIRNYKDGGTVIL
jgi:nitrogen fixation NifU-like protein